MSAAPQTGITYDIRATLSNLAGDLRQHEGMIEASARRARARAEDVARKAIVQEVRVKENLDELERNRFRSTGAGAASAVPGGSAGGAAVGKLLDSFIKIELLTKLTRGYFEIMAARSETIRGNQEAAAGNVRSAAEHYVNAAERLAKIPIAGEIANSITGDAAGQARAALQSADAENEKVKQRARQREEANRAANDEIARSAAAHLPALQREIALEDLRHQQAMRRIDDQLRDKQIGAEKAAEMRAAENRLSLGNQQGIADKFGDKARTEEAAAQAAQLRLQALRASTEQQALELSQQADALELEQQQAQAEKEAGKQSAEALETEKRRTQQLLEQQKIEQQTDRDKLAAAQARRQIEADQAAEENLRNQQIAEQKRKDEAALEAAQIRRQASVIKAETAGDPFAGQLAGIKDKFEQIVAERGFDTFGRANQDPAVIAAAEERAKAEVAQLIASSPARNQRPEVLSGSASLLTFFGKTKADDQLQKEANELLKRISENTSRTFAAMTI